MNTAADGPSPSSAPLEDFSHAHVGITTQLKSLGGLVDLLAPAARARQVAADALAFFDDVIKEHHAQEERELFPAVLSSSVRGEERDRVQALVDRLVHEHREVEKQWAGLVPGLKNVAKGRDATLDPTALQRMVHSYMAHAAFEEREFLPLSQTILGRNSNHMAALAIALHMRQSVPEVLGRLGHRI
ncbi:hemerythrin HHE cation binding domain-containing protein [Burkholderiales bacterium JOSHI_001]|nr:hemerythrin HHE cation binding domain-containing protein [Burkholderiales bacterium JOSHI_001]